MWLQHFLNFTYLSLESLSNHDWVLPIIVSTLAFVSHLIKCILHSQRFILKVWCGVPEIHFMNEHILYRNSSLTNIRYTQNICIEHQQQHTYLPNDTSDATNVFCLLLLLLLLSFAFEFGFWFTHRASWGIVCRPKSLNRCNQINFRFDLIGAIRFIILLLTFIVRGDQTCLSHRIGCVCVCLTALHFWFFFCAIPCRSFNYFSKEIRLARVCVVLLFVCFHLSNLLIFDIDYTLKTSRMW